MTYLLWLNLVSDLFTQRSHTLLFVHKTKSSICHRTFDGGFPSITHNSLFTLIVTAYEAGEINIGQIETASGPHYAIKVKIYEAKEKKPNICRSKYLECELRPLLPADRSPAVLRHIVLAID